MPESITAKREKLLSILNVISEKGDRVLIFCDTKKGADILAKQLKMDSWPALCIHGDKTQPERDWVLAEFKSGDTPIMIATDVAARGLDVKDVKYVVNYNFPNTLEDYIHRIGRTGRAGATGTAYTFFTPKNSRCAGELIQILTQANQKVPPELFELAKVSTRSSERKNFRNFRRGGGGGGGGGRSYHR